MRGEVRDFDPAGGQIVSEQRPFGRRALVDPALQFGAGDLDLDGH